jgi:hypothetical protein
MITLQLNRPQADAMRSQARETFLVGGVGMGKSFFLGASSYQTLVIPRSVSGLFAPTVKMLKNSTIVQVQAVWERMGFIKNVHYVVNQIPPQSWGVPAYSNVNNNKILTTCWGSYMVLDGLENFDSQRGTEFDRIFIDEFQDVQQEARNVLLGRLRGNTFKKLGMKHRINYAFTPPRTAKDILFLRSIHESNDPEIKFVFGTSYANKGNLPKDYLDSLKNMYDDRTYRREILGELLVPTDTLFAYAFNSTKHVSSGLYVPGLPLYLSFDFNVNPMTCIVIQHKGMAEFYVVDEFAVENADVAELCRRILSKYNRRIVGITGDASGRNRSSLSLSLGSHYDQITRTLGVSDSLLEVSPRNPEHRSSQILVNSVLQNHRNIKIDSQCKGLIEDLSSIQMKGNSIDKSDLKRGHLLDCFRYAVNAWLSDFISYQKPWVG